MKKNNFLILGCSPRKGGNSDYAAHRVMDLTLNKGLDPELLFLRDYKVMPCLGCHQCADAKNFSCVLDKHDQCRELLEIIDQAEMACFCSPIYFYHVPAGFKALIDRGQSFYERWMQKGITKKHKKALCVLVAGRKKGENLFKGSLLTMKYFLEPFDYDLSDLCLKGVDLKNDLKENLELQAVLSDFCEKNIPH
ncbi:MAG: flavodoxin family protein [Desulfonatronovibrio sp. MSAO_Bac4]|nr:MAG: flavodoxin family protein [Desulfonatronovibrio sp. MSAO_Bac4]